MDEETKQALIELAKYKEPLIEFIAEKERNKKALTALQKVENNLFPKAAADTYECHDAIS